MSSQTEELLIDVLSELKKSNAYKEVELLLKIEALYEAEELSEEYKDVMLLYMERIRNGDTGNLLWPTWHRQNSSIARHNGEGARSGSKT
jgi:hypothetical protein